MGRGLAWIAIAVLVLSAIAFVKLASAEPTGGTVNVVGSSRKSAASPGSTAVAAGNVTEVTISGTTVTQSWAGFYGNVTGTIVLADSNDNTFYDWSVTSPQGEVYASRSNSITWSNIQCASDTEIATENTNLNMGSAADNITNTFNQQSHPAFYVGTVSIAANTCKSTNAYNESGSQNSDFYNVLLSDGSNIVYTAILEQDANNFKGTTSDFELLVGEDGHGAAGGTTTTYYFWVEIE